MTDKPKRRLPASIHRALAGVERRLRTGPATTNSTGGPFDRTAEQAHYACKLWRDTWILPVVSEILAYSRGEITADEFERRAGGL